MLIYPVSYSIYETDSKRTIYAGQTNSQGFLFTDTLGQILHDRGGSNSRTIYIYTMGYKDHR